MITTLHIKNMVCSRCKRVIQEDLAALGLDVIDVQLGEVVVQHTNTLPLEKIRKILHENGFALLTDKTETLVETVKSLIIDSIRNNVFRDNPIKMSEYIEQHTGKDYRYVSSIFTSVAGITIEKYVIGQRIERAKELLIYDEMPITEIAFELGYSSTAYLSNQFKQETVLTPSAFKNQTIASRQDLDTV